MKMHIMIVGSIWAATVAIPALAQNYLAADPAADATPQDLSAVQAPWSRPDIDISHKDRLYISNATGDRICVVDPKSTVLLGCLSTSSTPFGPAKDANGHQTQLAAARDGRLLTAISTNGTGLVVIDTATNGVVHRLRFDHAPAGVAFTPNGRQLWIALPGADALVVLDTRDFSEIACIALAGAPASLVMSPDGHRTFVALTTRPGVVVIDTKKRVAIGHVDMKGTGASSLAVSPDGKNIWASRSTGGISIFATKAPFALRGMLETGAGVAAVNFAHVETGSYAYVAPTDRSVVDVYDVDSFRRVASIPLNARAASLWPSGDGTAIYAALPGERKIEIINTGTNRVASALSVRQSPEVLVYVPGAVRKGLGRTNLIPVM